MALVPGGCRDELGALGPLSRARAQAYFTHVLHDMDDAHRCSSWATVGDCSTVLPEGWSMRTLAESWVLGGVVEAAPHFREWFLAKVREHTALKEEQANAARFEVVPHLDMAGARGAAIAALERIHAR